ncbi:SART-1 protein [Serendipita vermifera]|nr:SART-1 protein [Serendipita vermifera]
MPDAVELSIEETNKIRISLGLKPLTDDKAPVADKEKEAEDNYAKAREKDLKARNEKALRDKISKIRNKRELNAKLTGATLGDTNGDDDDTRSWVKKNKKMVKELARRKQRELEEMDNQFQASYGEEDLVGLKVSHDIDGLVEGEEQILTLKDSRILEDAEDELQNVLEAEHKRTEQRIQEKAKNKGYTGYDDDEFAEGQAGLKKKVLAKYDDELNGAQEIGFRIGSSVQPSKAARAKEEATEEGINKTLLSIDYIKNQDASDYLQEGDIGFKKPKKKKRANRRVVESELPTEDQGQQEDDQMAVDSVPSRPLKNLDTNFVDDDELQAALARSRKAKMRKVVKLTPEELAKRIAEEKNAEADDAENKFVVEDEEIGLTIDDTTEFVQSISLEAKPERRVIVISTKREPDEDAMDEDDEMEELEAGEVDPKAEEELQALKMELDKQFENEEGPIAESNGDLEVGTAAEKTHSSGLAGTLSILRAQGALQEMSSEQRDREKVQKHRDAWLAEQRAMNALRELERAKARGANKDQQQREYENRLREQQEARQALKSFENYKPDINIVYHDEFGREMTPKEAWKALSHRFHGKGSGKAKTEKRLKKIAEEKKMQAMVSGETPLGMASAFQARQEKLGQAHMVLSVGNRGAAPQLGQYLESPNLTKSKAEKKKKAKEVEKPLEPAPMIDVTHFVAAAPTATTGDSSQTPVPRAKFAPVGSFIAHPAGTSSGDATPITGGRLALNLKRKAEDEGTGTPPSKKR